MTGFLSLLLFLP